jgi:hypothetical protein
MHEFDAKNEVISMVCMVINKNLMLIDYLIVFIVFLLISITVQFIVYDKVCL